ncbi:PREDICTED: mesoderm posterior protein 2-like [Nanorana parkeri]|uniref:mesoderm posterior protein 2-like n=1 Tax=Nanorana parkeri TaxID=125878 RepID=UPI000854AD1F|nr:PREDICTED: mesoderm posterior protein 2-like [Nanorana parkeri]
MDSSSAPLHYQDCNMYQNCATLYQCGYPSSEGYSSLSPASSIDSSGLSPPYMHYTTSQEAYGNISSTTTQTMSLKAQIKNCAEKKSTKKGKLPYGQRQSASEREKMRMRNLSKALQNLRRYLPPSMVPADKPLTKIETLQLTIRYISHLSEQLGLSEDVLEQRRLEAMQRLNRCPQNFSQYIDMSDPLCSKPTEKNSMSFSSSTEPAAPARLLSVEPELQNSQNSYNMSYEIPYFSELQTSSQQLQYATAETTLPQLSTEFYSTCLQQMMTCDEYTQVMDTPKSCLNWKRASNTQQSSII